MHKQPLNMKPIRNRKMVATTNLSPGTMDHIYSIVTPGIARGKVYR